MNTVELIEEKLEDFGLLNINENTTVFVDKTNNQDVEIADSEFNSFTKAHTASASFFVDFDGGEATINHQGIEDFVRNEIQ